MRVKYMAYAGTMQENCLRLMSKKLLVSLAMEGKLANHGLQALDDDDDMLTAMARELVTQEGVGEKADACWREVQREHTRLLEVRRIPMPTDDRFGLDDYQRIPPARPGRSQHRPEEPIERAQCRPAPLSLQNSQALTKREDFRQRCQCAFGIIRGPRQSGIRSSADNPLS